MPKIEIAGTPMKELDPNASYSWRGKYVMAKTRHEKYYIPTRRDKFGDAVMVHVRFRTATGAENYTTATQQINIAKAQLVGKGVANVQSGNQPGLHRVGQESEDSDQAGNEQSPEGDA